MKRSGERNQLVIVCVFGRWMRGERGKLRSIYSISPSAMLLTYFPYFEIRSSGKNWFPNFFRYDTDRIENGASNNSSIVACGPCHIKYSICSERKVGYQFFLRACACVCVCERKSQSMTRVPARVNTAEGKWLVIFRSLHSSKRRPHFKHVEVLERTEIWSWIPTGPKSRLTVLARTRGNSPTDRFVLHSTSCL
jgi:hypothetical protein